MAAPHIAKRRNKVGASLSLLAVCSASAIGGVLLAGVVERAGAARHIGWLSHPSREDRKLLAKGCYAVVLGIVVTTDGFVRRRRMTPDEWAAAERRRNAYRDDLAAGFRWRVPVKAQLASVESLIVALGLIFVTTFLVLAVALGAHDGPLLSFHRRPTTQSYLRALGYASIVPSYFAVMIFVLGVLAKEHVILGPEGIITRVGKMRHFYPYASIRRCKIAWNPGVRECPRLEFAVADGLVTKYFTMGPDVAVACVAEGLRAKGVEVDSSALVAPSRNRFVARKITFA